jgi:hypothetical protein
MAHPQILALNAYIEYTSIPGGYHQQANLWGEASITINSPAEAGEPVNVLFVKFQDGPIQEHGVNGVGIENVIEILVKRLEMFQDGPFKCSENEAALQHLHKANAALASRTAQRVAQGVEGTNEAHKSPLPDRISQFFTYSHLPAHLQAASAPFGELASFLVTLPMNPERTVALRKLLESKDAAVRAVLYKEPA